MLYQFARLVEEVKPQVVSMENVPELLKEQVFIDFLNELEAQKYNVSYEIVNAADYGVPQRRKDCCFLHQVKNKLNLLNLHIKSSYCEGGNS